MLSELHCNEGFPKQTELGGRSNVSDTALYDSMHPGTQRAEELRHGKTARTYLADAWAIRVQENTLSAYEGRVCVCMYVCVYVCV